MKTDQPLGALDRVLWNCARAGHDVGRLVHQSDAGSQGGFQCTSIGERLTVVGRSGHSDRRCSNVASWGRSTRPRGRSRGGWFPPVVSSRVAKRMRKKGDHPSHHRPSIPLEGLVDGHRCGDPLSC